jgi:hypothetical protein
MYVNAFRAGAIRHLMIDAFFCWLQDTNLGFALFTLFGGVETKSILHFTHRVFLSQNIPKLTTR